MSKKLPQIVIFLLIVFGFYGFTLIKENHVDFQVKGESESSVGKLAINFLDVGQGDATLIRTPSGDDILIDGGPDDTVIKKLGEYLPANDWKIELIILSHPHSDHVTGLVEVLKRYKVDKILMTGALHTAPDYLAFLELIKEKSIPVEIIDNQKSFSVDKNIAFDILYPNESLVGQSFKNLNNSSIVAKLVYNDVSVLFPGDFENEESFSSTSQNFKADIYKVSHHGSNTGNSLDFLKLVNPTYAVISVGQNNLFGHPHYRTLKNLKDLGVKIFRTDQDGDVNFLTDGLTIDLKS